MRMYVDGVLYGTDSSQPYNFAWDTTKAGNGVHALEAKASDAAGNSSSSTDSVTVSNAAADTVAPAIAITSPANNATVSGNVSVTCSARDNVGVAKVELYVDGKLTDSSTRAPFAFKWNSQKAASGVHSLQAKAYDAAGNAGLSTTVSVKKR